MIGQLCPPHPVPPLGGSQEHTILELPLDLTGMPHGLWSRSWDGSAPRQTPLLAAIQNA